MKLFKRIVVAVDFSEFSRQALAVTAGLASLMESEVIVLHVCTIPASVEPAVMAGQQQAIRTLLELQQANARHAESRLNEWVERLQWGKAKVQIKVTQEGAPHAAIIETAQAFGAELIVMGSYGRSGVARMLIGSTTEKVLRRAHVAVLAIPTPRQNH